MLICKDAPVAGPQPRPCSRFGPHPRLPHPAGRHDSLSYLQIVFRAEHVRVPDADASEGHRDEDRSPRLLPAVVANLQGHPGRRPERLGRTRARSVAREAGVTTGQPFRVRPGRGTTLPRSQRAPGAPLRSTCGLPSPLPGRP